MEIWWVKHQKKLSIVLGALTKSISLAYKDWKQVPQMEKTRY